MTPAEFRLLEVLASSPAGRWTRTDLGERAFGLDYEALDRTIDAHVMNLRRKLERDRAKPDSIETVFGVGYRFRAALRMVWAARTRSSSSSASSWPPRRSHRGCCPAARR